MTIDIILTFGKHNGKKLSQVPVDYVRWLSEQDTICGKKEVPQTAQAYLSSLPKEIANALRYSIPRTAEEADKLAWMAGKGNREAARTLLAARNADGYIPVDFEDADGEEGFFFVYPNGTGGFYAGSQADIDEREREAEADAKAEAYREAHPDLEWIAKDGGTVKVWHEIFDGEDQTVTVLVKGQKVEGLVSDVPASQRAFAKANGIIAVIATRLGPIGLTAERKAALDALR